MAGFCTKVKFILLKIFPIIVINLLRNAVLKTSLSIGINRHNGMIIALNAL